jgi:DNA repair exonuclease SbcCD ATPase subunit
MIYFRKIRFKNFLSTGNIWTNVLLDKTPNTLIVGVNGAGKSTLLDALTFALFGKSFRGINKPELVNSINEKECLVELDFRIGNKEYKIERGIKPAVFNIYIDGEIQKQDARATDYQAYLETNILKFNYRAFTQIVILGSSSFIPFMQLEAADRRGVIEDLLDIRIFSSMNTIVKSKLNQIKNDIHDTKIKLDSTLSKIELQKKYVEEARKNSGEQIEKKTIEYKTNETYVNTLVLNASLVQKHIDGLMTKVSDEKILKEKITTLHSLESKIEQKLKVAAKHYNFYTDHDNCPTCMQDIDANFKKFAIEGANTEIREFKDGLDKIAKQTNKIYETLSDIEAIQKKIHSHQSELTRINASVVQIQQYMSKLQNEINELANKKVLSNDMLKVSEDLVKDLESLSEIRKKIVDDRKYLDVAFTLLKDNGIKTKIIRQYLPVINKLINKYLAAMDFFVNFEIDEEFNETIKSRHRDTFSYQNFSEGEKMRIDLALLFTWRSIAKMKNSMDTNLLILDEVFDSSLDNTGTEEFMKLLQSLGSEANVFVISHKGDILVDKFRSVIRFEKVNNFSRIST